MISLSLPILYLLLFLQQTVCKAKPSSTMNGLTGAKPAHFVVVPLMAQGHMIPMVDLARLLADRGAIVSFITTPVNAARIKPIIDGVKAAGLPIRFIEFQFPGKETGLPDGCENIDQLDSVDFYRPFFDALSLLQDPLLLYLRGTNPKASCMVTDYCNCWWTSEAARELNIPRFIFHGPSCFFILASRNIRLSMVFESVEDDFDTVVVPGLPQKIEITRSQAPVWFGEWKDLEEKVLEAEATAVGVIINTFQELEPDYIELYAKSTEKVVLPIGPLSLYNKDISSKATRGNKSSIEENQILNWLDSMEPKSVLFVSFGSIVRTQPPQLIELGCALEVSNRPFIWVMKEVERRTEVEKWMSEGFEERTRGRSLIITGWAPQMVILSHSSVGGFMTHCGWNSTLEAVSSGVPMVTWPHFADQYLNEKLVVEVLRVGVSVGNKVPYYHLKEGELAAKRDAIEKAVVTLMDGGEEGKVRRVRAEELREKAWEAMAEGGTSYQNLTNLIQFALEHADNDMAGKEL